MSFLIATFFLPFFLQIRPGGRSIAQIFNSRSLENWQEARHVPTYTAEQRRGEGKHLPDIRAEINNRSTNSFRTRANCFLIAKYVYRCVPVRNLACIFFPV